MKHAPSRDMYSYTSHGEFQQCDLCGNRRLCNENDGLVACQDCQRELLPTDWAL